MFNTKIKINTKYDSSIINESKLFTEFRLVIGTTNIDYKLNNSDNLGVEVTIPCEVYKSLDNYYLKFTISESLFVTNKNCIRLDGFDKFSSTWLLGLIRINNDNSFKYDGNSGSSLSKAVIRPGLNCICLGNKLNYRLEFNKNNSINQLSRLT